MLDLFIVFLSTLSLRRATNTIIHLSTPTSHFYPRSPCGERRAPDNGRISDAVFLSTLSLRRATRRDSRQQPAGEFLSTLSLRRATALELADTMLNAYFYPRSPCGERQFSPICRRGIGVFLSTLSLRRATNAHMLRIPRPAFLSTLSLRRATRSRHLVHLSALFLSTLSLRRATTVMLAQR